MTVIRAVPHGIGSYLPEKIITNDDLAERLETSDDWIVERTGISQRHVAAEGELTSDLARHAAERALADAGMSAGDLDLIILATTTPDQTFPSTATRVQNQLGMEHGFAFDIQAVCSGFLFAITTATQYIETGMVRTVLVIGAETYSRILDWDDRTTAVLFGDGAGALVLHGEESPGTAQDRGILGTALRSDGTHNEMLYVDGGPSSTQTVGHVRMRGREVFRHAVKNLSEIGEDALKAGGLTSDEVRWIVPHQANARIISATARKLDVPEEKVIVTVDKHANTSAASVPLALDTAVQDGRVKRGDLLLLEAMGGGFTWGAAAMRW